MKHTISFIIPTYHSSALLPQCLPTLISYPCSEVIIVDNHTGDNLVAASYGARAFVHGPDQRAGRVFGAPFQRDFGAKQAFGDILYFVDADMLIEHAVIDECLQLIDSGCDAVIVAEESYGTGFWAQCKWLERRCYWGDDSIEAPRVIRKKVYDIVGGLDGTVVADDWDLALRLRRAGYRISRTRLHILHNEGALTLRSLARKRFLYAKHIKRYLAKHRKLDIQQATPFRYAYFKNWRLLCQHPLLTAGMVLMKSVEFAAAAAAIAASFVAGPPSEPKL